MAEEQFLRGIYKSRLSYIIMILLILIICFGILLFIGNNKYSEKEIKLKIGESAGFNDIEIKLKDVIEGELVDGAITSVELELKKGNENKIIFLSRASEGYESRISEVWEGVEISLIEVDYRAVKIKISRI